MSCHYLISLYACDKNVEDVIRPRSLDGEGYLLLQLCCLIDSEELEPGGATAGMKPGGLPKFDQTSARGLGDVSAPLTALSDQGFCSHVLIKVANQFLVAAISLPNLEEAFGQIVELSCTVTD